MKEEPLQIAIRLKKVLHFESTGSEYDAANTKLKEGWLYLGMKKDESLGEIYLILGQPENTGIDDSVK